MKTTRSGLAVRYLAALRSDLRRQQPDNGDRAQGLGRKALQAGFVTLDLAQMHEEAVVALASSHNFARPGNEALRRAGVFFTQALKPLEAAAKAIRRNHAQLQLRNLTLRRHTAALALGNRRLAREVVRRKAGEALIRRDRERYRLLLLDSQGLHRKLRLLTRQIIVTQEEERMRISRELHDEVVQTLIGINVELSALLKGTAAGLHSLRLKLTRTQRLVQHSVSAVHRFARELRPAALDDLGLIPALHAYCRNLAARKKIRIRITAFRGVEALAIAKRIVLYRVAQEALTNIVRHAQATLATITLRKSGDHLLMEVHDNGRSFPVEKTLRAKKLKRLGLIGMTERVAIIGGTLTIESAPAHGTTVRAQFPFQPAKNRTP